MLTISNNTMVDHNHHIEVGCDVSSVMTNISIHDNEFTNWDNWQFGGTNPSDSAYHTDGLIAYTNSSTIFPINFYTNYLHGNLGNGPNSPTAFITCGVGTQCTIFNNLVLTDSHTTNSTGAAPGAASAWVYHGSGPHSIYNNTFIGYGNSQTAAVINQRSRGRLSLQEKNPR